MQMVTYIQFFGLCLSTGHHDFDGSEVQDFFSGKFDGECHSRQSEYHNELFEHAQDAINCAGNFPDEFLRRQDLKR